MSHIKDKLLTVISKNGSHLLQTPSGEIINGLVFTRVYDGLPGSQSYVIVKILVNIKDTEQNEQNNI